MKILRLVMAGELIKKGDLKLNDDGSTTVDHCYIGWNQPPSNVVRPIEVDEWISYAEQRPTKGDFEPTKLIEYITSNGGGHCHYDEYQSITSQAPIIHWRRITPPTTTVKPIKVQGKEIVPMKNGSIKISCGTIVPKEDVEKLLQQREEVMKNDTNS